MSIPALFILLATAAPADPHAGAFVATCRQMECAWTRIIGTRLVRSNTDGTLKIESSLVGSSEHRDGNYPDRYSRKVRIDWEKVPVQTYVYCSKSRPAIAFKDRWNPRGGWFGHLLDPFETFGYNEVSNATYLRVCHGPAVVDAPDRAKALRALGYRPGTRNEQVDLQSPLDLMKPPPRSRR